MRYFCNLSEVDCYERSLKIAIISLKTQSITIGLAFFSLFAVFCRLCQSWIRKMHCLESVTFHTPVALLHPPTESNRQPSGIARIWPSFPLDQTVNSSHPFHNPPTLTTGWHSTVRRDRLTDSSVENVHGSQLVNGFTPNKNSFPKETQY